MENLAEMPVHHTSAASSRESAANHFNGAVRHFAAGNHDRAADHATQTDRLLGEASLHTAAANRQHSPGGRQLGC